MDGFADMVDWVFQQWFLWVFLVGLWYLHQRDQQ